MKFLFVSNNKHASYIKDVFAPTVRDEGNEIMFINDITINNINAVSDFNPDFVLVTSTSHDINPPSNTRSIYWDIDGLESLALKNANEVKHFDFIFVGKSIVAPIYQKFGVDTHILKPETHRDELMEEIKDMIKIFD